MNPRTLRNWIGVQLDALADGPDAAGAAITVRQLREHAARLDLAAVGDLCRNAERVGYAVAKDALTEAAKLIRIHVPEPGPPAPDGCRSVQGLAALAGVMPQVVYDAIYRRELKPKKVKGQWRIMEADCQRFVAEQAGRAALPA